MKCQILFSGKNKKNIINLSSAELAKRVVKVKERASKILSFKEIFLSNLLPWLIYLSHEECITILSLCNHRLFFGIISKLCP